MLARVSGTRPAGGAVCDDRSVNRMEHPLDDPIADNHERVPLSLLWDALAQTGVPVEYIAMCQGLNSGAAFVIGNAEDGSTAPIQQRVGVFQGCPLSPHLFSAAISPLLHALDRLQTSWVQLSSDDRPKLTVMAASPAKCRSMGVRCTAHGSTESDNLNLSLDDTPIPTLTLSQSYTYLGIGDGFDHAQRSLDVLPLLKLLKQDATALMESIWRPGKC
ncbi:unnamed protein product [Peronospora belbahrii]|uniref:Reverse transcriptase domain-containing protein n=1 Tax=Peronospora belbahrii TaxID=622444 RepID=A0ABN8D1I2_9STRA|nr:unnamed protein product [Peronospora belbahrii]